MIQPKLSVFDIAMIVVSLVIGVGIFRTPAIVAQSAGSAEVFFAAWVAGGFVSLCSALTYAEIIEEPEVLIADLKQAFEQI